MSGIPSLAWRPRCTGIDARSLFLILTLCALTAGTAFGDTADIHDGIGVFADGTMRHAYLEPGEPITLWVRGDRLFGPTRDPSGDGVRAIQFGVRLDPRLMVVQKSFAQASGLEFEVAPDEWILGMDCLKLADGYPAIMSYTVLLPPGTTDTDDLRVSVGDLVEYGEPMAWTTCGGGEFRRDIFSAGGLIINPSPGAIAHFSAAPRVVVEGEEFRLAWETIESDEVLLDGQSVGAVGQMDIVATQSHDYVLSSTADGVEWTEQLQIEVLREPRIDSFTAERRPIGTDYQVHLSWVTHGADRIVIDGAPGHYPDIGSVTFLDKSPSEWILRASNQWGTSAVMASPDPIEDGPPLILDFSTPPGGFSPNEPVSISWSIVDADEARIEPGIGPIDLAESGMEIFVTADTELELIASNAFGESRATLGFDLSVPKVLGFDVEGTPFGGFPVSLTWETVYAETLHISPFPGEVTGSSGSVEIVVPDYITELVLTATNAVGSATKSLNLWPLPPRIQLRAPSLPVVAGVPFTFEILALDGAMSARVEPDIGPIAPEAQLVEATITEETLFTVSAVNVAGSSSQSMIISLGGYGLEPPTVALSTDDPTPSPGSMWSLDYVIENAQSATLGPDYGTLIIHPRSGSMELLTPTEPTTYVLTATNPNGTSTAELTVSPAGPEIVSFTADDNPLPYGQASTTLRWEFTEATASGIAALGLTDLPPLGSVEISPTVDTDYELVVSNAVGELRATLSLVVMAAPLQIVSFDANPPVVRSGDPVYLSWELTGAFDEVGILGFGPQPSTGQLLVHPTQTTSYTLQVHFGENVVERIANVTVDASLLPDLLLSWSAQDPQAEAPVLLPFQPFDLWALAVNSEEGITGASFRLEVPECLTLLGQSFPSGGLNLGAAPDVILGLGACDSSPLVALTEYSLMINQVGGCPAETQLSFGAPSVGSQAAERSTCANLAVPFRLDLPLLLYEGSGGQAQPLELNLNAEETPEGVALSWNLPGQSLPTSLCLHRLSSAGDERLEEWANKDLSKDGNYLDVAAPEGEPLEYWLEAEYPGATVNSRSVQMELTPRYIPPDEPVLVGAAPNPFNPRTSIEFELDRARHVSLRIYDLSGRRIWSHAARFPAGLQGVVWTGVDHAGRSVASGSYFVQLEYEGGSLNSRLTLVR